MRRHLCLLVLLCLPTLAVRAQEQTTIYYNKKRVAEVVGKTADPPQVQVPALAREDVFRVVLATDSGVPPLQRYQLVTAQGDTLREFIFRNVAADEGVRIKAVDFLRWRSRLLGKHVLYYLPEAGERRRIAELIITGFGK